MGIPYYFSYIIKNYPNILLHRKNYTKTINNLYIDSNSIIYDCFHAMDDLPSKLNFELESRLITMVIEKIHNLISIINPNNKVFIAFDGVAPVAKLDQQRERRYKSDYDKIIRSKIASKHNVNLKEKTWSTCNITPGTSFMNKLNTTIKNKFASDNNIIFSGSNEPGEGEHKIYNYIRTNNFHKKQSVVIYGLDADLIMLSLCHKSYCKEIHLWRETPNFIESLNSGLDPNEIYFLDINLLSEKLMSYLKDQIDDNSLDYKKTMNDYIFLCFLLGNDFLPHFPAVNIRTGGIDKLMMAYKATITNNNYLTNNSNINWCNFKKLIDFLSVMEEDYLIEEYNLRNKKEKIKITGDGYENEIKKFDLSPCYNRAVEHFINPKAEYWQKRYYSSLFNIKQDDHFIKRKRLCINYLQGLEWSLKYYTEGCYDWSWNYKYNYPPLLVDLMKFIPNENSSILIEKTETTPVPELVQLAYVLPVSQLNLLPPKYKNALYHQLGIKYRNDFAFQSAFCKYFWESHVIMDEIPLENLKQIFK